MFNNLSKGSNLVLFLILFITFFSPSCASQEEKLSLAKQEVEVINSKLDKAVMITGLMFRDENRFAYRAYFVDDKLVYIFSDNNHGTQSASTNFYYFNKEKLLYYSSQEVGFDPVRKNKKRSIKTDIYFDGNEILESVRTITGNYAEINNEEVEKIKEDALKLYNAALEKKKYSK